MSRNCVLISSVLLVLLGLSMSACQPNEPNQPNVLSDDGDPGTLVYATDSTEWRVKIFKEHLLYSEAVAVKLPAPWRLPVREEAQVLRNLEFSSPSGERFVTSDGYTFGMPSASVSKAGSKTRYSVLGLHIRRTVIVVEF